MELSEEQKRFERKMQQVHLIGKLIRLFVVLGSIATIGVMVFSTWWAVREIFGQ